jgi:hypothetical protein
VAGLAATVVSAVATLGGVESLLPQAVNRAAAVINRAIFRLVFMFLP